MPPSVSAMIWPSITDAGAPVVRPETLVMFCQSVELQLMKSYKILIINDPIRFTLPGCIDKRILQHVPATFAPTTSVLTMGVDCMAATTAGTADCMAASGTHPSSTVHLFPCSCPFQLPTCESLYCNERRSSKLFPSSSTSMLRRARRPCSADAWYLLMFARSGVLSRALDHADDDTLERVW